MRFSRVATAAEVFLVRHESDEVVLLYPEGAAATADAFADAVGAGVDLNGPGLGRRPVSDVVLRAPLRRPGTIWAVGLNYVDHARESGLAVPEEPVYFIKASGSVLDPGALIEFDETRVEQVDAEVELAVVIGCEIGPRSQIDPRQAIFGYTVANDVSARELQFREGQWCHSKSIDTFCPLGPWIVPAAGFDLAAPMTSTVNGRILQTGRLSDMIHSPVAVIAHLSEHITLNPGDVVLTGTPAGVGFSHNPPVCLGDGDQVTVEITGIGALSNTVRVRHSALRTRG